MLLPSLDRSCIVVSQYGNPLVAGATLDTGIVKPFYVWVRPEYGTPIVRRGRILQPPVWERTSNEGVHDDVKVGCTYTRLARQLFRCASQGIEQ